jgi:hypothetical protein
MLTTARELYAKGSLKSPLLVCEIAKDAAPDVPPRLSG